MLARRLIERGVPFVEVSLNGLPDQDIAGWDTHTNNFEQTRKLCEVLDLAWSTLMDDLDQRGMLDETLIVWMGEFGRTPRINPSAGRDHFPNAWTVALAGGGIRGGQAFGRTSKDGMEIAEGRLVSIEDLLGTVCAAIGVDPMRQNMSNVGRPIRIVDPKAEKIVEILA